MIRFTIFGIPVQVDIWFWITMAVIGGAFTARTSLAVLLVLVFMFAGFLSILVHELGHALMIRRYNLPTSITLQAFGGYATYPNGATTRKQDFLITLMGPVAQIGLGLILLLIKGRVSIPEGSLFDPFLNFLILVSIAWAILNCLPVYPLDGGRLLTAVLGPKRESTVYLIGAIVGFGIVAIAILWMQAPLLALLVGLMAWQNLQMYQNASS